MVAWGAIASAVGNVAGSLFSGLSSSQGGGTSIAGSKALMDHQLKLDKEKTQWLNENSYKQMRTGLENAGYNPLLAVGSTPQSGSVGIANATEGTTAKGINLKGIADVNQILTNTAQTKAGVLGSIFGTDLVNSAKGFLNDSGITKSFKKLIRKSLNTANGAINSLDKATDNVDNLYKNFVLKGYVSNTANSEFDYTPEYDELGRLPRALSRYK